MLVILGHRGLLMRRLLGCSCLLSFALLMASCGACAGLLLS